jgi:hypothetical protein
LITSFKYFVELQICAERQQCFDLSSRKDPTTIGTDEFKNPILTYYTCNHGDCREIYDLTCERRCDDKIFRSAGLPDFF